MQCQEVRDLLSAYMDEQLGSSQQQEVSAHIKVCEECRAELEELREAVGFLRQLPELPPPPEFRARLMQQIASEFSGKPAQTRIAYFFGRRWVRFVAAAVVICLALGITTLWYGLPAQWGKKNLVQNSSKSETVAEQQLQKESGHVAGSAKPGNYGHEPVTGQSNLNITEQRKQVTANSPKAAVQETRDASTPVRDAGREVSIMAVPPTGDESQRPQDKPFLPPDREQEVKMMSLTPDQEEEPLDKKSKKIIHVLNLTVEVEDFTGAKDVISAVLEQYEGSIIKEEEKTLTLGVPAQQFEPAVSEINDTVRVVGRRTEERDISGEYNDICLELKRLRAEEQQLAQKENLATGENERLEEIRNKIRAREKQLHDLNDFMNMKMLEIDLKLNQP